MVKNSTKVLKKVNSSKTDLKKKKVNTSKAVTKKKKLN